MPDTQRRLMGMNTGEWARYLSRELGVRMAPGEVARGVVERMTDRYARDLPLIPGAVEAVRRMGARCRGPSCNGPLRVHPRFCLPPDPPPWFAWGKIGIRRVCPALSGNLPAIARIFRWLIVEPSRGLPTPFR